MREKAMDLQSKKITSHYTSLITVFVWGQCAFWKLTTPRKEVLSRQRLMKGSYDEGYSVQETSHMLFQPRKKDENIYLIKTKTHLKLKSRRQG